MIYRVIILCVVAAGLDMAAGVNPFVREFPAAGTLEFKIEDKLHQV